MPSEWQESQILAETHWTWEQLQNTPSDVVDRLMLFLSVRSAIESGGELTFDA